MLRFFRRYIKSATAKIFLLSVLGMLSSGCGVYMALISKKLVDVVTLAAEGSFLEEGIKLALVLVLQLGLHIGISALHVKTQAGLKRSIQGKFFAELIHKSKLKISKMHSGELVNRLAGDIGLVAEGAAEIIPSALTVGTQIILSFAVLAFLDITLALICLALGPVMLLAAKLYRDKASGLFLKSREAEGEVRSFLQESIQNISVIKAFSAYDIINNQLKSRQDRSYKFAVRKNVVGILANICFFTAMTAGYYVALAWGAYRLKTGAIGFGTLTALITLSGEVTSPFRTLASLFQQYMSMRASVLRLEEIELFPGEEDSGDVDAEKVYSSLDNITFDGIKFSYGDGFVLRGADATFEKSTFTAVTGESGIGKSTVLGLLAGIYKQAEGEISLNCDKQRYPLTEAYQALFAYVPQDILILSGTIKENITFFAEQVDEERLSKVIKISCLHDEIIKMPKGIDTVLGENGSGLSGGQRQRIAIARALYSRAKILLLDEATSALSQEVEEEVIKNIKKEGYTAVVVTHRDSVISLCDKVLIVKNAKIADSNYLKLDSGGAVDTSLKE